MRLLFFYCLVVAGLFFAFQQEVQAQGCSAGILLEPGTLLEYRTYKTTKKNPHYIARHQVLRNEKLEDRTLIHLKCAFYDKNDRVNRSFDYFMGCLDDMMIVDKEVLSDPDNLTLFEDKEFSFDGKNIHYPAGVKSGDTLQSAVHTVNISSGPVSLSTITTALVNRRVDTMQTVETPAGTFECYKISYTRELTRSSRAFSLTSRKQVTEYVVPNLGVVRSETLNKRGKVIFFTQLEKLVHPKTNAPAPKL